MGIATLLLTGTAVPYHVVDYAINWAKDNEGSLRALFIIPGKLPDQGYPFPNDLHETEEITVQNEGEPVLNNLVKDEIRFIEKRCKASHIPVKSEIIYSPRIQKVVALVKDSDVIFVDKNAEENESEMKDLPFTFEDIIENTTKHFVSVGEMDRYSDVFY